MILSALAKAIPPSPTLSLNEQARVLKEKGEAVVHLGAGEPKNKAPAAAIQGGTANLAAGMVKYTPTSGLPSLKKAIVRYTEEFYGRSVGTQHIIVSSGAKLALYNAMFTILNPGDEVIILAPYWVSYPEMIRMVGAVPVVVTPGDGSFFPRMDEDIIPAVSPRTRIIIVNSPNNPSGVMYPADFIARVVQFCEEKDIFLIMDDIYHRLIFDGKQPISPYAYTRKDPDSTRIIAINGVSKLYGMTGFRIGWAVAPKEIIDVMVNVQAQTISCVSSVLQAAAEGALTGPQDDVDALRATLESNRNVMLQELSAFKGITVTKPDGTYYCLPDFRGFNGNSIELSRFLLQKALVVTVPGKEFGMDGFIRLSYATAVDDIREGIARIRWALDPTAPREITIGKKTVVRDWA